MSLRRALVLPLVALIRLYQRWISPIRPQTCKYYPSCSAYAVTSLERHGILKGSWLAVRRLGRCNPWSLGGVDHVPPRPGEVLDELGRPHPNPPPAESARRQSATPTTP